METFSSILCSQNDWIQFVKTIDYLHRPQSKKMNRMLKISFVVLGLFSLFCFLVLHLFLAKIKINKSTIYVHVPYLLSTVNTIATFYSSTHSTVFTFCNEILFFRLLSLISSIQNFSSTFGTQLLSVTLKLELLLSNHWVVIKYWYVQLRHLYHRQWTY